MENDVADLLNIIISEDIIPLSGETEWALKNVGEKTKDILEKLGYAPYDLSIRSIVHLFTLARELSATSRSIDVGENHIPFSAINNFSSWINRNNLELPTASISFHLNTTIKSEWTESTNTNEPINYVSYSLPILFNSTFAIPEKKFTMLDNDYGLLNHCLKDSSISIVIDGLQWTSITTYMACKKYDYVTENKIHNTKLDILKSIIKPLYDGDLIRYLSSPNIKRKLKYREYDFLRKYFTEQLPFCKSWNTKKHIYLSKAIHAKCQIPKIKNIINNSHAYISYYSNDKIWGDGKDGSGMNIMGLLLMSQRRAEPKFSSLGTIEVQDDKFCKIEQADIREGRGIIISSAYPFRFLNCSPRIDIILKKQKKRVTFINKKFVEVKPSVYKSQQIPCTNLNGIKFMVVPFSKKNILKGINISCKIIFTKINDSTLLMNFLDRLYGNILICGFDI